MVNCYHCYQHCTSTWSRSKFLRCPQDASGAVCTFVVCNTQPLSYFRTKNCLSRCLANQSTGICSRNCKELCMEKSYKFVRSFGCYLSRQRLHGARYGSRARQYAENQAWIIVLSWCEHWPDRRLQLQCRQEPIVHLIHWFVIGAMISRKL